VRLLLPLDYFELPLSSDDTAIKNNHSQSALSVQTTARRRVKAVRDKMHAWGSGTICWQ